MMNIQEFTLSFPHIRQQGDSLNAKNVLSVMHEDGSGYSFNLTMWVNGKVVPAYIRFDAVTHKPVAVMVDGHQCTWY